MSESNGLLRVRTLLQGGPGSGKTHLSATFPKFYAVISTPGEEDTWKVRPGLAANAVKVVYAAPTEPKDTKRVFEELAVNLKEARDLATKGEVITLVIDNFTNLVEHRWVYINEFEKQISRTGEIDTRGMYGSLGRWCHTFVTMGLLTFPGNLVVIVHEQVEEDDTLDKLPDKTSPISPAVLGGFRHRMAAYFSLVLSLEKQRQPTGQYKFLARTNKGNQRNAKSRYPLPELLEDISYSKIQAVIQQSMDSGAVKPA